MPEYVYVPECYYITELSNEALYNLPDPSEFAADAKSDEVEGNVEKLDWYNGLPYNRRARRIYVPPRYQQRFLHWFHAGRMGGHQGIILLTPALLIRGIGGSGAFSSANRSLLELLLS